MPNLSKKNKLIALFFLALAFELFLFFIFHKKIDTTALFVDSRDYQVIALNVVNHGTFSHAESAPYKPSNFRAPLYPLWLGLMYLIFKSFKLAIFAGMAIFALASPITYLIAEELFDKKVAWLSGILFAFEPWAAFLGGTTIMSEQLFMPVFLLSTYLFIRYLKYNFKSSFYLSAIFFGAATLTRPYLLYFWFIIAVISLFKNQKFFQSLKISALATLIFLLTIAPWVIRNKMVLDSWQLSTVSGFSLYVTNFNALQIYLGKFKNLDDGYTLAYKIIPDSNPISKEGSEILMREALKGIKQNFPTYIKISILSLPNFFISNSYSSLGYYWGLKDFKIQSQVFNLLKTQHFSDAWSKISNISWGERMLLVSGFFWPIVSILFLIGVIISLLKFIPLNLGAVYIISIIFYFDIITTLMIELARFRIMAQPFIFMFAAATILYFIDHLRNKNIISKELT